jgi:hypothetical protein
MTLSLDSTDLADERAIVSCVAYRSGHEADSPFSGLVRRFFAALVIALLSIAILMPSPHVTAVKITATVETDLSEAQCEAGGSLTASFIWLGQPTTKALQSPDCATSYRVGQAVTAYAASNDASNLGPSSDWILNPDEHHRFDFMGPNGLPSFIGLLGGAIVMGGAVLCYFGWERPRRPASLMA